MCYFVVCNLHGIESIKIVFSHGIIHFCLHDKVFTYQCFVSVKILDLRKKTITRIFVP